MTKEGEELKGEKSDRVMNEEELKEWKQSFADIQEGIDKVMEEGEDI